MLRRLSRLWREPLLHFLVIGAALFVFYELTRETYTEERKRIHVDRAQLTQLVGNFERAWSRPPTQDEFDGLIESHLREEVFYREALAMGLEQNDPIVRRRLRMKLEFMLEDLSTQPVTDDVLNAFLQQHQDKFRSEAQLSFRQIFLDPDRRPDLVVDAERLLSDLNGGADPDAIGDPTLAPRAYELARRSEIARDFGDEFANELVKLAPGDWRGPVYSPFGAHLVAIDERIDARLPSLVEVRDQVLREVQQQRRKEQEDLVYQRLREGYEITVEPLGSTSGSIVSNAVAGETK